MGDDLLMGWTQKWRTMFDGLKRETYTLYFATKHPGTPWGAKVLAICVVAYALSPIDLIPDFIPILGHLDDLVVIPLGVLLVRRMIPPEVLSECRQRAQAIVDREIPSSRTGAVVVVIVWLAIAGIILFWIFS